MTIQFCRWRGEDHGDFLFLSQELMKIALSGKKMELLTLCLQDATVGEHRVSSPVSEPVLAGVIAEH